ncbi:hypothetical protein M758_3G161700 [Ceratodon purpureus]|nr:hypothetical protein M758_3G161700 [Ceratodon purpureus]
MSFLRPNVSEKFQTLQSFFLWFQMAYSVWQFMRTAKFFRLPYVMVSSVWNGIDSWIKTRNLIMMRDDLGLDNFHDQDSLLSKLPEGTKTLDVGTNVEVSFGGSYKCLTSRHRAAHMMQLRQFKNTNRQLQFGRDDDLLWPKAHLIRSVSFEHAMDHVLAGKGYDISLATASFFDYSSKQVVNQNFVRFASIWPLILQARSYDFWSVIFSIVIILMDLFSYWANKVWKFVQYWISRLVKWMISQVPSRERRIFLFTFMATISTWFYCQNFVTEEASSKVVRQVLLATHIRLDKHKIGRLEPIICTKEVPRKDRSENSAQNIKFKIHGVEYEAKVEPALSDREPSSVFFRKQNIKEGDWTMADMAYFFQVCDYCDRFKFSPIKLLDGNNAKCCSFAEIVKGVKTRNFVLCEFRTAQKLFIT